jgi:hypothetical protein
VASLGINFKAMIFMNLFLKALLTKTSSDSIYLTIKASII